MERAGRRGQNTRIRSSLEAAIWVAVVSGILVTGLACDNDGDAGSSTTDATPFVTIEDGDDGEAVEGSGDDGSPSDSTDGEDPVAEDDFRVPSDLDACALLTADEVVLAIGVPVDEGERFDIPPFYDCEWSGEGGGINISVFGAERAEVESFFEIGHEADERVGDVGEEAFWDDEREILEVLSGNYSVTVSSVDSATLILESAANLADIVISRLP